MDAKSLSYLKENYSECFRDNTDKEGPKQL
jgi:hypothetical protein